jgi:hypothetical protein
MPAAKPSQSLPVCTTVAKPAMAAHSIMPSAPRLTMPDFSLIEQAQRGQRQHGAGAQRGANSSG